MKKLLIPLFILTGMISQAENFRSGYVITNEGDTIFGQIDLRTNIVNKEKCIFRSDTGIITTYYPFDIHGYFCTEDGKYYVSRNVEIDGAYFNFFVEYLVKGIMNLYYIELQYEASIGDFNYNKNIVPYYLFEKEDGTLLLVTKAPDRINENNKVIVDKYYQRQLGYAFKDIDSIKNDYSTMSFSQKSMINIAQQYHHAVCTTGEECVVFNQLKPDYHGGVFKISVYAGVQMAVFPIKLYHNLSSYYYNHSYPLHIFSISPVIGAEISVKNPRISKSLAFVASLDLSSIYGTKDITYTVNTLIVSTVTLHNKFACIVPSVNLGMKYTDPNLKWKIKPSFKIGASYRCIPPVYPKNTFPVVHAFGGFASAGFDYALKNSNSLNFSIDFSGYIPIYKYSQTYNLYKSAPIYIPAVKLGYTF
jgi:hypothetical protein